MNSELSLLKSTTNVTMPWEEAVTISKTVIIDSRQRDSNIYSASHYKINLGFVMKNINSVELKGAIIPKICYNVHCGNNKIDFSIGDSVTVIRVTNGGGGYTVPPFVFISSPQDFGGVQATATAFIDSSGRVSSIVVVTAGSGYYGSKPPDVVIANPDNPKQAVQAKATANVGYLFTATLREGEYEIGGNPNPPTTSLPTGLLLEIQNSMNYAVNGGAYNPTSTTPFNVVLVSQYPTLTAIPGTPESFDTNACQFNRIQIVNTLNLPWEFLWYSGPNASVSACGVLGFDPNNTAKGVYVPAIGSITGAGTAIRGKFDYNLKNDADYVILSVNVGDMMLDRINSVNDSLDHKFCTILFDNNNPDTLHNTTGTFTTIGGVDYLTGDLAKGTFWRDAGAVKPIKGADFDGPKKITFKPPQGKISSITVKFTKFGNTSQLYNMDGREHILIFEFSSTDQKSHMKE